MKRNRRGRAKPEAALFVLTISVLAFSCGGGAATGIQGGRGNPATGSSSVSEIVAVGPQTIREDEVASVPGWMQDLLSDPGWNQPYIEPRGKTPMPAPSTSQLLELTRERMANPRALNMHDGTEGAGKGVSWGGDGGIGDGESVLPGEYATAGPQPYGCVNGTLNGHAREENIALRAEAGLPNGCTETISYVLQGLSTANHFNLSGGLGNDALSCVYQLFSSDRFGDPGRDFDDYGAEPRPQFGEISYRADGGQDAGGACAGEAYVVEDFFWWRFNSDLDALPGTSTQLFNVLIAPSGEATQPAPSPPGTTGRYQPFYLGTVSACYGGGGMVGLLSATENCETDFGMTFAEMVTADGYFFTNPVYGLLLSRWLDLVPGGADLSDPTAGNEFGWPVFGPVRYNNGVATQTGVGVYYAWGMYYEKGFIWWLDYVNNNQVPDEAQAYIYTGDNVYCNDGKFEGLPAVYYGGQGGALGVSVTVDASLNPDYTGVGGLPAGSYYEVGLPAAGPQVTLSMFANGFGGTANEDCAYKHYTWAFRDGSIGLTNTTAFDNSTKYVSHTYGYPLGGQNTESIYIVRVQVVDANNAIAYGDSLPILFGHSGGGGGSNIWVVRNDNYDYPTNYDAIIADLDALGCAYTETDYTSTIAADFDADTESKVVVWYRGGPGVSGDHTQNTVWTDEEIDQYIQLQRDGAAVLLMSQSHSLDDNTFFGNPGIQQGWVGIYGYSVQAYTLGAGPPFGSPDIRRHAWAAGLGTDDGIGFGGSFGFIPCAPASLMGNAGGPNGYFGTDSSQAAERYTGGGSSGRVPVSVTIGAPRQFCGIGWYRPILQPGGIASRGFRPGMAVSPAVLGFDLGYLSWGNQESPDENVGGLFDPYQHQNGPGKLWVIGYGWAETRVTAPVGMTRADMLRNILAWLDSEVSFAN